MKKIYLIGMAIVLAGGMMSAADTLPAPTLVMPEEGTKIWTPTELASFVVDWGEALDFVNPVSATEKNPDFFDYSLQEVGKLNGINITAEYYGLVQLTGDDNIKSLIVGLYSAGEGNGSTDLAFTGITCLGLGLDSDGFPMDLENVGGSLTLTIPAGLVKTTGATALENAQAVYEFSVLEATSTGGDFSPAPGVDNSYSPSELSAVTVTWKDVKKVELSGSTNLPYVQSPDVKGGDLVGEDQDGDIFPVDSKYIKINEAGNALVLDLSWLPGGEWVVNVPKGFVILDGTLTNMGDMCTYLVGVYGGEVSFAMADNVITATWADATNLTINTDMYLTIEGVGEAGAGFKPLVLTKEVSVGGKDDSQLIVDLSGLQPSVLPTGSYKLIIPENYLTLTSGANDYGNQTAVYTFEFVNGNETGGIQQIGTEAGQATTVYNLNGQKVANPTKGIFIINGKKVLVK